MSSNFWWISGDSRVLHLFSKLKGGVFSLIKTENFYINALVTLSVGGVTGIAGANCCTQGKWLGDIFFWTSWMQVAFIFYLQKGTVLRIKTDKAFAWDEGSARFQCLLHIGQWWPFPVTRHVLPAGLSAVLHVSYFLQKHWETDVFF